MQVMVPFRGGQWPTTCPCCGGRADSKLKLQQSKGVFLVVAAVETVLKLEVPYCARCVRHVGAYEKGTLGGLLVPTTGVLFAAFFLGIVALAVKGGGSSGFEMTMLFWMPSIVTVGFVAVRVVLRMRAAVDRRHVSTGSVLKVVGWTEDAVLLECASPSYGLLLQQAARGAVR